jgi:hypothetical protein
LADETIDLGLEFGIEEQIVGNGDIGEVGGGTMSQRQIHCPPDIEQPTGCFYVF